MFPWWVSWLYRWWMCTGCLLVLLLAFSQPVHPVDTDWMDVNSRQVLKGNFRNKNIDFSDDVQPKFKNGEEEINYEYHLQRHTKSISSEHNEPNQPVKQHRFRNRLSRHSRRSQDSSKHLLNSKTPTIHMNKIWDFRDNDGHLGVTEEETLNRLISAVDITSLEVPSTLWRTDTRVGMSGGPKIPAKDKRTPPSRKSPEAPNGGRRARKNDNNAKGRILKTLVTTPKRIIGSLQGMGGSAVKPAGSSVQHFATEPAPQTAVVGSTAVLPCRFVNCDVMP